MGKTSIEINKIYGDFQVISRNFERRAIAAYWNCRCVSCGLEKVYRSDSLKKNPNCQCHYTKVGQQSKEFLILEKTAMRGKDGCIIYKCQCQKCGNLEFIPSNRLRGDSSAKRCSECYVKTTTLIDLTGYETGYLKVLYRDPDPAHYGKEKEAYWVCQCQKCGAFRSIRGFSLTHGLVQSCGCIKSKGEEKIAQLLYENRIIFKKEFSFSDLVYKNKLKFDFAIFDDADNLKYLIEYDGEQHFHYRESGTGWNTKEAFQEVQIRDFLKNCYCQENKIPLIRIPYTSLNDLSITDLLLETSSFILKGE